MNGRLPSPVLHNVVLHDPPRALRPPARVAPPEPPAVAPAPSTEADLRAALERAFEEGLEAGREQGRREGSAGLQEALQAAQRDMDEQHRAVQTQQAAAHEAQRARLERLLDELPAAFARRLDALEHEAVELAFAAVCRLVGEDASSPARVAGLVSQALQEVRGGAVLAIRLSEADLALIASSDEGQALIARHPAVAWRADPALAEGGCVIDLPHGRLDARLGVQLERLRALWSATAASASAPRAGQEGGVPCRS